MYLDPDGGFFSLTAFISSGVRNLTGYWVLSQLPLKHKVVKCPGPGPNKGPKNGCSLNDKGPCMCVYRTWPKMPNAKPLLTYSVATKIMCHAGLQSARY
jgi:hypothetical protein